MEIKNMKEIGKMGFGKGKEYFIIIMEEKILKGFLKMIFWKEKE